MYRQSSGRVSSCSPFDVIFFRRDHLFVPNENALSTGMLSVLARGFEGPRAIANEDDLMSPHPESPHVDAASRMVRTRRGLEPRSISATSAAARVSRTKYTCTRTPTSCCRIEHMARLKHRRCQSREVRYPSSMVAARLLHVPCLPKNCL